MREQVGGLLRGILDRPPRTTLYFLFRGTEPLELSLEDRERTSSRLTPSPNPPQLRPPIAGCCNCGGGSTPSRPGCCSRSPTIRRVVENYLTATLARRLNLRLPEPEADAVGLRRRFARKWA